MYRLTTSRRARAMTICAALFVCAAQITPGLHAAAPPSQNASATPPPGLQQWSDSFDGQTLDAGKWENFALAGTPAKAQVGGGQLKLRGTANARAGIRSKTIFDGERLLAEATVVRTGTAAPPASSATLAVLFDDAGKSRIEWTLTGDGKLEAYDYTKGEAERLEGVAAGAATATAKLGIARRGADFYFTLNDQVLLHRAVSGVPPTFRVMLYGSGAGEVIWDGAQLAVQKTPAAAAPASVAATAPTGGAPTATAAANVWMDEFNGEKLDDAKWEPYTFDGGGGVNRG